MPALRNQHGVFGAWCVGSSSGCFHHENNSGEPTEFLKVAFSTSTVFPIGVLRRPSVRSMRIWFVNKEPTSSMNQVAINHLRLFLALESLITESRTSLTSNRPASIPSEKGVFLSAVGSSADVGNFAGHASSTRAESGTFSCFWLAKPITMPTPACSFRYA